MKKTIRLEDYKGQLVKVTRELDKTIKGGKYYIITNIEPVLL